MRFFSCLHGLFSVFVVTFIFGLSAGDAQATSWSVKQGSALSFSAEQMGKSFTGTFSNFDVDLNFDPDQLEQASVFVGVDMTSYNTGDAERDETLAKADWFNPDVYPDRDIFGDRV
mgnify:CR=1 FL=1